MNFETDLANVGSCSFHKLRNAFKEQQCSLDCRFFKAFLYHKMPVRTEVY